MRTMMRPVEPKLEIIMPMAGAGKRFRAEGVEVPKPLIQMGGKPLFYWALAGLRPLWPHTRVSVISVKEDNLATEVCGILAELGISNRTLTIPGRTKGPAETVSMALRELKIAGKFISLDCDLYLRSPLLINKLHHWPQDTDGLLPTFKSRAADFSYAAGRDGIALAVKEKVAISETALAGCYAFSEPRKFMEAADSLQGGPEIYISQVVQRMIETRSKFLLLPTEEHIPLGTPVQLRASAIRLKEAGAFV